LKISTGKLAKQLSRGSIVGAGGVFCYGKSSQGYSFAAVAYVCLPFSTLLIPTHPLESARVGARLLSVCHILTLAAWSKIRTAIIETIAITMVRFQEACDLLVHCRMFIMQAVYGIPQLAMPNGLPVPLRQPFVVGSIYDCIFTSGKWNQAVGCVERLDNRVSFHAFFHRPSFKGLVKFSRYFNIQMLFGV